MSESAGQPISTRNVPHYKWGNACEGWHLVRNDRLSVIQERIPPGASERKHRHTWAQQFFFVLQGALSIDFETCTTQLVAGEGVHIAAGVAHQVGNHSDHDCMILVISEPPSHGDREYVLCP
jgi:quercetin dioxygenase-like cupin family protein